MAPTRPRSLRTFTFSSSKRPLSPGPPSPTFSDATNASAMNFGTNGPSKIITRANLKASIQAFEDLLGSCTTYRAALVAMSKASAAFADAIERCSGLKGPNYETGTRLQAASGMQHLIGNLHHVLAETLDHSFEKPLRQQLETYRTVVHERSQSYERSLREKSQIIRDTEMRSLNRKERNLQSFREALTILQQQVDDLDDLKVSHYQEIIDHEEKVWDAVQNKVCVVIRSTMDVYDRVTAKASDPIIEPMLQSVPDPFDSYGVQHSEDQIFSILAPLSIMNAPSPSPSPVMAGTPETDSTPIMSSKIASWLPGTSDGIYPTESSEWATTISPPRSPPQSHSPPPTSNGRRNTLPQRKAESKLRSVLPSIDEKQPKSNSLFSRSPPPDISEVAKNPMITRPALSPSNRTSVLSNIATTSISSSLDSLSPPPTNQSRESSSSSLSSTNNGTTTNNGFGSLIGGGGAFNGFGFGAWNFSSYGQAPYSYANDTPEPADGDHDTHSPESTTEVSTPRLTSTLTGTAQSTTGTGRGSSPPQSGLDLASSDGDSSGSESASSGNESEKREVLSGQKVEAVFDPVPN